MKNDKAKEAARQGEKAIRNARAYIEERREEIDEAIAAGREGWVEKSQKALASIEKAVADLSRKIEVYKKEPLLDEKKKKKALMAIGAAAAVTAAVIGARKMRSSRDEAAEEEQQGITNR